MVSGTISHQMDIWTTANTAMDVGLAQTEPGLKVTAVDTGARTAKAGGMKIPPAGIHHHSIFGLMEQSITSKQMDI